MAQTQEQEATQQEEQTADNQINAQVADFPESQEANSANKGNGIEMLLDIDMPVNVSLGSTQIPIRKILQLGPGSVMKLDKTIDQPAELYVQDIKFATGEIVVVDNHFAIRITEIIGTKLPEQKA